MDEEEEVSTVTAIVKWFNPHKRYGFVHIPDRDQDAFMHASVLSMDEEDWPREDVQQVGDMYLVTHWKFITRLFSMAYKPLGFYTQHLGFLAYVFAQCALYRL